MLVSSFDDGGLLPCIQDSHSLEPAAAVTSFHRLSTQFKPRIVPLQESINVPSVDNLPSQYDHIRVNPQPQQACPPSTMHRYEQIVNMVCFSGQWLDCSTREGYTSNVHTDLGVVSDHCSQASWQPCTRTDQASAAIGCKSWSSRLSSIIMLMAAAQLQAALPWLAQL